MNAKVDRRGLQPQGEMPHGSHYPGVYQPVYPGAAQYDDDGGIDIGWLWLFFKRRFALIATTIVVGTVIAAMVGFTRPVLYTATAEVVIEPTDTRAFGFDPEAGVFGADAATLETEMRVARSPDVAFAVIDRLGLERRMMLQMAEAENAGTTLAPALQPFARLFELIPADILVATGLASEVVQLEVTDTAAEARRMALDYLEKGLTVRQSGRSRVFQIGFTADNPTEAQRVANAIADSYVEQQLARKVGGTTRASSFLETRLDDLEQQLRAAEQAIKDYRAQNRLLEMSGRSLSEQELSQLSSELISIRAQREDTQGRLAYIRGLRERGGDALESVGEILQSPLVAILLQEHIRLQRRQAELLSTFGDRHPQVVSVRADMEGIVTQIAAEADRYISGLENEISLLGARENAIREQMDRASVDNVRQAEAMIGLRELERQADNLRNLYNSFLLRFTETREQRQVIEADARVIARAERPNRPSSPGVPLFAAVGFVASGMFGVLLGLLRERLDRGIRSNREIEAQLGVACLGQVPFLKHIAKARLQPHAYLLDKPRSAYAEAIRSVGTYLRMSNVDDPPRMIQVTSSIPGEGKTTFSTSLATMLAKSGQNTVLVDLDFHHPSVARSLALEPERCLVDYMLGDATLQDILYVSDFGLTVLPIRRQAPDPSVLINSQRMRQLLKQLRETYDFIVVDSPPVLLVSDPKSTSELVDTTLLLVRWQDTSSDKSQNALKELEAVGARIAGAVLSQVDMKRQEQYGYAGVGSYYKNYRKYYVD